MRHLVSLAIAFASAALAVAACSDDKGTAASSAPSPEAGPTEDGGSGSSKAPVITDGGGKCTGLVQAGESVDIIAAKLPIPEASGGTPVDGHFVLTSVKAFADILPEGSVVQAFGAYTLTIKEGGTGFEQVVTTETGENRASGSLVTNGVEATASPDCEDPPSKDGGFTIISGKFSVGTDAIKLYVVRDFGITAELTFEKR